VDRVLRRLAHCPPMPPMSEKFDRLCIQVSRGSGLQKQGKKAHEFIRGSVKALTRIRTG